MKVYTRPFQKEVYDKVDGPSKEALIKYLESEGHTIVSKKEDYYADVVTEKDGVTFFHEAERKAQWKEEWPTYWEEIRIPEREKKTNREIQRSVGELILLCF